MSVSPAQRFGRTNPCPACQGHGRMPAGRGVRCYGFLSDDGRYAHCTREEHAGGIAIDNAGTFAHILDGPCRCGATHGAAPVPPSIRPPRKRAAPPHAAREERHVIRDTDGTAVAVHVRKHDQSGEKTMWWARPDGAKGLGGVKAVDLPLYGCHELDGATRAVVVEGEPARDKLAALGIPGLAVLGTVTGSATIPSDAVLNLLLRFDRVDLWPDAAADGARHMGMLGAAVLALGHPDVRLADWPDAPEKGDAKDFVDGGGTAADALKLLDASTPLPAKSSYAHCSDDGGCAVSEFPVDVFPDAIARYVATGATALNVPTDMIALPLLGFAAGAMGNTVALGVKPGWIERANLWLAIIGEPGSGKSPTLDYARAPLDALQKAAWERFAEQLAAWERATAAAKADKTRSEPPPDKPNLEHFYSTDATPEALAVILATSPGVAVVRDELVGWVESFDSYKKGGERQSFLSLWAGTPLKVDRVIRGTTFVPRPVVPVIGGIQPDLLTDLAEEANRRDGFVDRMLMVWPEPLPQRWTDDVPDAAARAAVDAVFGRLRARVREDDKAPGAGVVFLSPEARGMFAAWFDENAALVAEASGIAQGCYAKFPSHLLRIALVLHALKRPGDVDHVVEPETVAGAIAVLEHLRAHLRKVLPKFAGVGTAKGAGLSTRIMRVLTRHDGGWMARSDLHRGLGNAATGDDLAAALERLSADGSVENRTIPTGARPREESRALRRRYEDMDNSTATPDPNSSYLHIFSGDESRATPAAELADDEYEEGPL